MARIEMFGLHFEAVTLKGATEQILSAADERRKGIVITPNTDQVVMLDDDPFMREVYENALLAYADGMPLVWVSRMIYREGLPERVTGADLLPAVCQAAARGGKRVYFLGGNPGIAEMAGRRLKEFHPGLEIVGTYCPPFGFEYDEKETCRIIDEINGRNVDILFIGVGAPKQEKWAHSHLAGLSTGPILCIGAAFDFAAGTLKRAPTFFRKTGLEWLWRLASEPRRLWRRYLVRCPRIVWMGIREIIRVRFRKSTRFISYGK